MTPTTTADLAAANVAIQTFYRCIGQRVSDLREQRAITQADLAAAVGLSRASIGNLEAGRQRVPVHTLIAIAQCLGIAPTVLFDTAAEMPAFNAPLPVGTASLRNRLRAARDEIGRLLAALPQEAGRV